MRAGFPALALKWEERRGRGSGKWDPRGIQKFLDSGTVAWFQMSARWLTVESTQADEIEKQQSHPGALAPPELTGITSLAQHRATQATRVHQNVILSSGIVLNIDYHSDFWGSRLVGRRKVKYAISGVRGASTKLRRGSTATLVCALLMTFSDGNWCWSHDFRCLHTRTKFFSALTHGRSLLMLYGLELCLSVSSVTSSWKTWEVEILTVLLNSDTKIT